MLPISWTASAGVIKGSCQQNLTHLGSQGFCKFTHQICRLHKGRTELNHVAVRFIGMIPVLTCEG